MNKHNRNVYLLINNDIVLVVSTNLKDFYSKILEQDIGFKYSMSTLRNRFIEKSRFNHPTNTGRIYWFQKIENDKD